MPTKLDSPILKRTNSEGSLLSKAFYFMWFECLTHVWVDTGKGTGQAYKFSFGVNSIFVFDGETLHLQHLIVSLILLNRSDKEPFDIGWTISVVS